MNIISHLRRHWQTYVLGALGLVGAAVVLTATAPSVAALQLTAGVAAVLIVVAATRAASAWTPRPTLAPALLRAAEPTPAPTAHTRDDGMVEVRIGATVLTLTGDEADELVAQVVAARTDQERAVFRRQVTASCGLCACVIAEGGQPQHQRWHEFVESTRSGS